MCANLPGYPILDVSKIKNVPGISTEEPCILILHRAGACMLLCVVYDVNVCAIVDMVDVGCCGRPCSSKVSLTIFAPVRSKTGLLILLLLLLLRMLPTSGWYSAHKYYRLFLWALRPWVGCQVPRKNYPPVLNLALLAV